MLSVAEKGLTTEATEILLVLCVETLEAQRPQRSWFGCGLQPASNLFDFGLVDRIGMAAERSQPSMAFLTTYNSSLFSSFGQEMGS